MHLVLPMIGVSRPFTPVPVASTLTLFTAILIAIAYIRDRKPSIQICVEPRRIFTPSNLLIILVFLLNIAGALIIYAYGNNIVLMMFTIIVIILVSLAAFGKFIKQRDYPLAITIIAISILYQITLISPNLIGIPQSQRILEDVMETSKRDEDPYNRCGQFSPGYQNE